VLRSRNRWATASRLLVFGGAATLFVAVVSAADVQRVAELVGAIGLAGLLVVLIPHAAALVVESYGWKLSLRLIDREVGCFGLLRVRVATEALSQSLPAGVLFGESVKPFLLGRHCGLSVNESVAAIVARKYLLLVSQAAYVLAVATLGFSALRRASPRFFGFQGLEWAPYVAGAILGLAALGTAVWLRQSAVAQGLFAALGKVPFGPLSRWLGASERRFSDTDHSVSSFFQRGFGQKLPPALFFGLGWFLESVETWVILRVLGANLGFVEVASIEVLLTFVRHVVFVVPAGLGVQDFGYVAGLAALGVPDASSVGAAFVLVKRTKEVLWIALGYALLAGEAKDGTRPLAVGTSSA
jgi:uncharacterized membrane protein YbhN (UPF0104 family)